MSHHLVNDSSSGPEDFSVLPATSPQAHAIFQDFLRLRKTLKSSDIEHRKDKAESNDAFLLKTAIGLTGTTATLYRKNSKSDEFLTSVWLSIANEKAQRIVFDSLVIPFNGIAEGDLRSIAKLSQNAENVARICSILREQYGIILIIEKAFASMRTDGCVYAFRNGTPIIALSLRFNRYDHFWFTLMHELAHVFLHYDHLTKPIFDDELDDFGEKQQSAIEVEANRVAIDSLVPRNILRKLKLNAQSRKHLMAYSQDAEVHPAISAGLVRYSEKNYAIYSDLITSVDVLALTGNR